jgi:hypothetical protein
VSPVTELDVFVFIGLDVVEGGSMKIYGRRDLDK